MSDLVPPPRYVEYPRDPQYRPMDEIGRLEVLARAYYPYNLPISLLTAILAYPSHLSYSWGYLAFTVTVSSCIAIAMRTSLTRVYRAKGWNEAFALWMPLVVAGIGFVRPVTLVPQLIWWVAFLGALIYAFRRAGQAVRDQFAIFGLKMTFLYWSSDIDQMIRRLREEQPRGPSPLIEVGGRMQ